MCCTPKHPPPPPYKNLSSILSQTGRGHVILRPIPSDGSSSDQERLSFFFYFFLTHPDVFPAPLLRKSPVPCPCTFKPSIKHSLSRSRPAFLGLFPLFSSSGAKYANSAVGFQEERQKMTRRQLHLSGRQVVSVLV